MHLVPRRPPRGRHFAPTFGGQEALVHPEIRTKAPTSASSDRANPAGTHTLPTQNAQPSPSGASSVARNSFIMFLGTLVSRILGLVRSPIILGAVVGLTMPAGNAFQIANKLPNLLYMIVVGGLVNAVLVPAIVRATKRDRDGGQAFINKLLTITVVGLGAITLIITVAAPLVVKMMAATLSPAWYELTVAFAYWCLPQVFFYGLYTVLGQILNARENFGPYMWAPVANNVVAILGMLAMMWIFGTTAETAGSDLSAWTGTTIGWLGGISTLGIAVQALILIFPMRSLGIIFRFDFNWRGSGLRTVGVTSWWMLLTMLVSIIPTALVSNVAAGASNRAIEAGMNTEWVAGNFAYDTAYSIYSIPTSLFVVSIATAVFTRMSKAASERNTKRMRDDVGRTLRAVSAIMFLCAAGIVTLAGPISRLFAMASSPRECVTLAHVVATMGIGLTAIGAVTVLNRVFYAFEDTRGAFLISLPVQALAVVAYIICGFLPPADVVVAVGIIMSVTNLLAVPLMLWALSDRLGGIPWGSLISFHVKLLGVTVVASLGGAFVASRIGPLFGPLSIGRALAALVCGGAVIVAMYIGGMKLVGLREIDALLRPIKRMARRVRGKRK